MLDYSFFALLFLIAQTLAPANASEQTWVNSAHPQQTMAWTREGDGWALHLNGREMGVFHRQGERVVHHTGHGAPDTFEVSSLLAPASRDARRIVLRGSFAPHVLTVERRDGEVRLVDPSREVLRVPLILRTR